VPIRQIPRAEWTAFFDSFSREHQGWLVTTEVGDATGVSAVEARELPLAGITAETAGPHAPVIEVMVRAPHESHLTHTIRNPVTVRLHETEQHAHAALSIESLDGSINTVRFRSAVPSELVDGFIAPDA
jgi:hypothetical protein